MTARLLGSPRMKAQPERTCAACGRLFQPKDGGYNAKYCGSYCKNVKRSLRDRELRPEKLYVRRRATYKRAMADPVKREKRLEEARKSVKKGRDWLGAYKTARGCVDCGYRAYAAALQLDHEGPKSVPISAARSSVARLQREITEGRCVVRCANCHAVKTWQRKQKTEKDKADVADVAEGA